jgi:hypothetical protein
MSLTQGMNDAVKKGISDGEKVKKNLAGFPLNMRF